MIWNAMMYMVVTLYVLLCLAAVLIVLGWKGIYYRLYLLIFRRACIIRIVNDDHKETEYLRTPNQGVVKVRGSTYVTNPDRVNYSALDISTEGQVEKYRKQVEAAKNTLEDQLGLFEELSQKPQENKLKLEQLEKEIKKLQRIVEKADTIIFRGRIPLFTYREGIAIPIDYFAFESDKDSQILDNVVMRAQTKPSLTSKAVEMTKWAAIAAACAAALAVVLMFKLETSVREAMQKVGVKLAA